jgi:3-phosphoshikimate 1-carboxyvinyltransferase
LDRIELSAVKNFKGEFTPPPDKSISHRAVILSSISKGKSTVRNVLRAKDTESTVNAFRSLGIEIDDDGDSLVIHGKGLYGLSEPSQIIDCGNSGTTIRLLSGVLSGNNFFSVLTGDSSLRKRPMARIIEPLSQMGADIKARDSNRYPPISIVGKKLTPIKYTLQVASAQVKSCLLLAGLYADGVTEIAEPAKSRDHSEKMLSALGADIKADDLTITVSGGELTPATIEVPGDFSSAAFFIVAALRIPDAEITIRGVGINASRTGLLNVLKHMGAEIELSNMRHVSGEPVADIYCRGKSTLKAFKIAGESIPLLIDEFPILCIAAASAEGVSTIRGAEELRLKESDRIKSMTSELRKMGVEVEEYPDGLDIKGTANLKGALLESYGDHRIAMSLAIAALNAEGSTIINGVSCVDISFPGFFESIRRLSL